MFNTQKFGSTNFERRTGVVNVDALAEFFEDGEEPEITVKGLTHQEVAQCADGIKSDVNLEALLKAAAGHTPSMKEAVGELLNKTTNTPVDTKKRILHLVVGAVKPEIDEMTAVKLAETFPIEFTQLTNKILELTGLGQVAVKKR